MWNRPTNEKLTSLPEIHSTEEIPLKDKLIYLHFFMFSCDWYIAEFDPKNNLCFGFAIINDDKQNAEWGYFSFGELAKMRIQGFEVDCDLYWKVKKASDIDKIKKCVQSGFYDEEQSHESIY